MISPYKFDLSYPPLTFHGCIPSGIIQDDRFTVNLVIPAKYAINGIEHLYRFTGFLVGRTGAKEKDKENE